MVKSSWRNITRTWRSFFLTYRYHELEGRAPAAGDDAIFTDMQRDRAPHEMVANPLPVHDRPQHAPEIGDKDLVRRFCDVALVSCASATSSPQKTLPT